MIPWLAPGQPFPPVQTALQSPNGLLAASAELTADRLLAAYPQGIFPWYSDEEPVLWWSPDPRMVLFSHELKVSRSFAKTLRKAAHDSAIELRIDTDFDAVIQACAEPRGDDAGTWITDSVADAYMELHRRGLAHSIETWAGGRLAGGLYGVALGRMFYGESMFARAPDASKIALALLVRVMQNEQVRVIDCQQNTRHLASLGAREISRREFVAHLNASVRGAPINWTAYAKRPLNSLLTGF
ncbi:MAG TPA: leucyl/phenylalanyl-tRNA--protein transferase [Burkholderiaceae bacterium]|jgi:leucyl/phenylalanyl-tRNA--protein transferase|nr:leucyl/phenylalanyl-tRNA--protein transferase [Burkholderiaceae bacterium]